MGEIRTLRRRLPPAKKLEPFIAFSQILEPFSRKLESTRKLRTLRRRVPPALAFGAIRSAAGARGDPGAAGCVADERRGERAQNYKQMA